MTHERREASVPREHGFWVMLGAVLLSALARHPNWKSIAGAVLVAGLATAAGARVRARVRREPGLQLSSSLVLGCVGLPVELWGGAAPRDALATAGAWCAVFAASTFAVWASMARSSRVRRGRAKLWSALSVLTPALAAAAFLADGRRTHALACGIAALTSVAFTIWRPGAKQLKPIGLLLAGTAFVAGVALVTA